jgi:hypothetical protein
MKRELEQKLYKAFPTVFGIHKDNIKAEDKTGMLHAMSLFGIEYSDGWFELTWDLCEKLEPLCAAFGKDAPHCVQAKEKFGGLRFYMSGETDEMSKLIRKAEELSCITCEFCGAPGKSRNGGWILTLCDKCHRDNQKEVIRDS